MSQPLDEKLTTEEIRILVKRNEIIEKELHEDRLKNKRVIKVLLLGTLISYPYYLYQIIFRSS